MGVVIVEEDGAVLEMNLACPTVTKLLWGGLAIIIIIISASLSINIAIRKR